MSRTSLICWCGVAAGAKGLDFAGNLGLANINFGTVHSYPQAFGIPFSNLGDYDNYTWINTYFIASRAAIAKTAGKPIILEEFGTVPQGQQTTPGASSYTNNYGAGVVQSPRSALSSDVLFNLLLAFRFICIVWFICCPCVKSTPQGLFDYHCKRR